MKRDPDTFRSILLKIEGTPPSDRVENPWRTLHISRKDFEEVNYHSRMLIERKFLFEDCIILNASMDDGTPVVKFRSDAVTDAGHEFLDSIRDPEVWRQTKEGIVAVKGLTLDLVTSLGKSYLKKKIKDITGEDL